MLWEKAVQLLAQRIFLKTFCQFIQLCDNHLYSLIAILLENQFQNSTSPVQMGVNQWCILSCNYTSLGFLQFSLVSLYPHSTTQDSHSVSYLVDHWWATTHQEVVDETTAYFPGRLKAQVIQTCSSEQTKTRGWNKINKWSIKAFLNF